MIDQRYVKKIKLMNDRCTRDNKENDSVLIIEGREGTGKTNASVFTAGMVKLIRPAPIHLFFNLDPMIKHAQSTSGQILIWDEPALDSLTSDRLNTLNKNLMKLLMTCRAKRHFIIINITDFTKFDPYIVIERPIGFVHLYKGKVGHGCYLRFSKLERLRQLWVDKKRRVYNKLKSFYLDFPLVREDDFNSLDMTINGLAHATLKDYKKMKDQAIASIGVVDTNKDKLKTEIRRLKKLIANEPLGQTSLVMRARHYKIDESQFRRWKNIDVDDEIEAFEGDVSVFKREEGGIILKLREGETGGRE